AVLILANAPHVQDITPGRENTGVFYIGQFSDDNITARGSGSNYLEGFDGNDTLVGSSGNDFLDGGTGNDTLTGRARRATLFFRNGYGSGHVPDFSPGTDHMAVRGLAGVHSFTDAMSHASQLGADAVFNFGSGDVLTLKNVALGSLSSGDFDVQDGGQSQASG